jgi:pSer/pThr/pTyr-binding forkhead associated (FHA) protein
MIRVVLRWIDSPWAFELLPGLNRLGRNPTNDFRVSDPSVSSFHVELTVQDHAVRVRDLGSTNGTFIDEQRITEETLTPGQVLRLGNVRFQLEEVSVTASPPSEQPSATVEIAPRCVYHPDLRAAFKCENCGAAVCQNCLTVVGQGKFEATTICPVCKGQCYPLPNSTDAEHHTSLLRRLTRTLRIPFSR